MKKIHGPETRDLVLKHLHLGASRDKKTILEALSNATTMIVSKLDSDAREKGQPWSDKIKPDAMNFFLGQLIEVGEQAGLFKLEEQDKMLAYGDIVNKYLNSEKAAGRVNEQELQQAASDPQLQQMAQGLRGGQNGTVR